MWSFFESIIEMVVHVDRYLPPLIQAWGGYIYLLLFFVIFMETGFVLTPFLPGDSLLFVAGAFAALGSLNPYLLIGVLAAAAILGDTVNYWIGHYFGERIFSKIINPKHLEKTNIFFKHYGRKTIVLARFVPIVRTFAPFVAGIGRMKYWTFLGYNIIGGLIWVVGFTLAGYYFGNIPLVKENLSFVILGIVAVSFLPAVLEFIRQRKNVS